MTTVIDFDGVIHAYSRGWHDAGLLDQSKAAPAGAEATDTEGAAR